MQNPLAFWVAVCLAAISFFKLLKFTCGFIREFWVADEYRNQAHGSALLALAEEHFLKNGIYTSILTTDTISGFLS